jgi:hypothetical protein
MGLVVGVGALDMYKAGDKVRLIHSRTCGLITFPVWTIFEVALVVAMNTLVSKSDIIWLINPIPDLGVPGQHIANIRVIDTDIELCPGESGTHACHCPKDNFRLNGIGCQCGGV